MDGFFKVIGFLSFIAGLLFAFSVKTDVGVLCCIIVIQVGFVILLLSEIAKNTKK